MKIKSNRIKKILCGLGIISITAAAALAQESSSKIWSSGSAHVLPQKRVEVGLFQALNYGQSENITWSTHPIYFLIMPNLSVKWSHGFWKDWLIASRHSAWYPTYLLRTIAREGTGGIISPEFDIPQMFAVNNEFLITRYFGDDLLLTAKAGLALGIKFGGLDDRTTIDLPLIYNRLAVFYHGYQLRAGIEGQGKFYKNWNYLLDADYFYIPAVDHNKSFEHKGMILWNKSPVTQIAFGYKLVYGDYPFGGQWHVLPVLDIQKAWMRK